MKSHGIQLGARAYLKRNGEKRLVWETSSPVNDKNKIIIENLDGSEQKIFPMKSFVSNFLCKYVKNMFNGFIYFNSPVSSYGKFADGSTSFDGGNGNYGVASIGGQNTTGIQVGFDPAGTPSVDSRDYNLKGLINHGNGLGQLYKNTMQGTELGLDSFGSSSSEFSIQREFMNNSGGDIVINECGLFVNYASGWTSTNTSYFTTDKSVLIARDVFPSVTIPSGSGKRIRYVISVSDSHGYGWTNNFLYTLRYAMSNFSSNIVKNVAGSTNYSYAFSNNEPVSIGYAVRGDEGRQYSGIALSTSTSAFSLSDYSNSGHITHGTSSGKLFYNAQVMDNYQDYDAAVTTWSVSREFQNYSGADITANSFMLLSDSNGYDSTLYSYLIARGLISGGVTIPNGDSLVFELLMSVDVGI